MQINFNIIGKSLYNYSRALQRSASRAPIEDLELDQDTQTKSYEHSDPSCTTPTLNDNHDGALDWDWELHHHNDEALANTNHDTPNNQKNNWSVDGWCK